MNRPTNVVQSKGWLSGGEFLGSIWSGLPLKKRFGHNFYYLGLTYFTKYKYICLFVCPYNRLKFKKFLENIPPGEKMVLSHSLVQTSHKKFGPGLLYHIPYITCVFMLILV